MRASSEQELKLDLSTPIYSTLTFFIDTGTDSPQRKTLSYTKYIKFNFLPPLSNIYIYISTYKSLPLKKKNHSVNHEKFPH